MPTHGSRIPNPYFESLVAICLVKSTVILCPGSRIQHKQQKRDKMSLGSPGHGLGIRDPGVGIRSLIRIRYTQKNRIQVHNCGSGSESLPGRCGPGMTPFLLLLLFSNIPDSSLLHFVCSGLLLFLIIFSFFTFTFTFTNVFCSFIIFFMYFRFFLHFFKILLISCSSDQKCC